MRALMVEDRPPAVDTFRNQLPQNGLACEVVSSKDAALLHTIESSAADVLLLSLPLAQNDALAIVKELRRRNIAMAIIVMQEVPNTDEALSFYDAGADDLVIKPLNPRHLAARARAIVRRQNGFVRPEIAVGDLTFYFDGRQACMKGQPLTLSRRERGLLECLVLRAGRSVSREFIFQNLYGPSAGEVDPKIIDVYVCKLRKKLRDAGGADYISTIFGMGYMLTDPMTEREDPRLKGGLSKRAA